MPVLMVSDPCRALAICGVLAEAVITSVEIILRTARALTCIEAVSARVTDITVGAGTVLSELDLTNARSAGAKFFVSLGTTGELAESAKRRGDLFLPGGATPFDVATLVTMGFTEMKLFPAAQLGGVDYLRAIGAPFPNVIFYPAGGITLDQLIEYLDLPNVAAVSGSWLTPASVVRDGDISQIEVLVESTNVALAAR
ncbi:MAG: 2-dehydro-3-deoxyphosphogluconate aldolase/(4S)-4-hydroxy-2-oxoglutarate aldolase [Candidatus Azotimanducaceae bacterium]